MDNRPDLESNVREQLNQIKSVPARNPQAAARARARFLAQAISASESRRRHGWGFIFRKQQFALNMVVALVVIAGLFVGGGTTVKAAQDDLPNEPLYAIKTLSEDVSLQFESDPEAKVDRLMELTQTRIQEMTRMVESGQTPPEQVRLRLEGHLQQTFQIVGGMADAKLDQELLQLRNQLQQHERKMQDLQVQSTQAEQPVLEHTRTMLQTQLHLVDDGLANHEEFRDKVNQGFHYGQTQTPPVPSPTPLQEPTDEVTPEPGNPGNGNGLGPTTNPGGPHSSLTPTPQSSATNTGNHGGGNDKDKDKDPKDKEPNENKPNTKTPKSK